MTVSLVPTNGELIKELEDLLKEDKIPIEAALRIHLKVSHNVLNTMETAAEKRHKIWVCVEELKKNPSLIYLLRNKTKSFVAIIGGFIGALFILHQIIHRAPDIFIR